MSGLLFVRNIGDVVVVARAEAKRLIAAGFAVPAPRNKTERAVKPPPEKRQKK